MWLVKIDSTETEQWIQIYGTTDSEEHAVDGITTSDGGYLLLETFHTFHPSNSGISATQKHPTSSSISGFLILPLFIAFIALMKERKRNLN